MREAQICKGHWPETRGYVIYFSRPLPEGKRAKQCQK